MYSRLFIFALVAYLTGCSPTYNEHPDYTFSVTQTGYRVTPSGENIYGLTFDLAPKRDSLKGIYLMTCAWPETTITSDPKFRLGTSCDANYLTRGVIPKGNYLELKTSVRHERGIKLSGMKFRAAFVVIDTVDFNWKNSRAWDYKYRNAVLDSLKKQQHRFVWSNEIQLKELDSIGGTPFGSWKLLPISSSSNQVNNEL